MKFIALLLSLLLITPTFAACEKNVQRINTGTSSPCTGWIISDDQMQSFAKDSEHLELSQRINKVNEQLIKLSETEIDYYKSMSKARAKDLEKAETRRFWSNVGFFALGVVLTGVAAKAAIESTR